MYSVLVSNVVELVLLRYFIDLDLKIRDSFKTKKHCNSHSYNYKFDSIFFSSFLLTNQFFLAVSRGGAERGRFSS